MEIKTQYTGNILEQISKAPATTSVTTPPATQTEQLSGQPEKDVFVKEETPTENIAATNTEVAAESVAEVPQTNTEEVKEEAKVEEKPETNEQVAEEAPKKQSFFDKIKASFKKIFGVFKKKEKLPEPEMKVPVENAKDSNPPLNVMHSSGGGTN